MKIIEINKQKNKVSCEMTLEELDFYKKSFSFFKEQKLKKDSY